MDADRQDRQKQLHLRNRNGTLLSLELSSPVNCVANQEAVLVEQLCGAASSWAGAETGTSRGGCAAEWKTMEPRCPAV